MFALSLIWDTEPSPGASPCWALLTCPEARAPKSRAARQQWREHLCACCAHGWAVLGGDSTICGEKIISSVDVQQSLISRGDFGM